jgi:hypothetical protein
VAIARPLPSGALNTSAPQRVASSAEPSLDALSTNQTASPGPAAAAAMASTRSSVADSSRPTTANVK